ncbi:hypothetical protein [Actinobacillus porcinus]|uniref:Uncharacterized protein n=1 Tax=Actinobacillus porcinus TaxID=51048 RepID=A0ABY6TM46_9PAST|nr:hypothetical protein [Actinobacillus porcinus]MCI5762959.1 hypothetical protein [Actinobacillus porcinus]MDD7545413.1 hypothetical protein [Actinobacillus porcinus]MDY5421693.1 hypothetical protein [Actinobacillus porcinus]MDY5848005.1 hypothetical protein [Actinobacillus porcinus]VFY93185.1 Uncharacterised protein [Actinobacillus porcinus]
MKKFIRMLSVAMLALGVVNTVSAKAATTEMVDEKLSWNELRSILESEDLMRFQAQREGVQIYATGDNEIWKNLNVHVSSVGVSLLNSRILFIAYLPETQCNEKTITDWNGQLFGAYIIKNGKNCNLVTTMNLIGGISKNNIKSTITIFAALVKKISVR